MKNLFLGVDPGWTNLGWCLLDESGVVVSGTMCPKDNGHGMTAISLLEHIKSLGLNIEDIRGICLERFVYYDGKHNPDSENILMVTGEFMAIASSLGIPFKLFRAIDWKTALAKHLWLKMAFKNPSQALDKKFSMAAAKCALDNTFKVDHEADGGCLAYLLREHWMSSRGMTNRVG